MTNELFTVWVSDVHFTDWDDYGADILTYRDMTIDEIKHLLDLSLVRGYETIIARQQTGGEEA